MFNLISNSMDIVSGYDDVAAITPVTPFQIFLTIIFAVVCLAIVVLVLMQQSKASGLGTISGAADTYWSKNKARSNEGMLVKLTAICAAIFFITAILLL